MPFDWQPPTAAQRMLERQLRKQVAEVVDRLMRRPEEPDTSWEERIVSVIEGCAAALQRETGSTGSVVPADLIVAAERVRRHLVGWDVLQPLVDHPFIEDIWVNSPERILFKLDGRVYLFQDHFQHDDEVQELVKRHIRPLGLHLDTAWPFAEARLPDGMRLHAVIPPATTRYTRLSLRKYTIVDRTLDELIARRMLPAPLARFLEALVAARVPIQVSGAPGAGKTTLLRALGHATPAWARVVVLEDTPELDLSDYLPNAVDLQTRRPNVEGQGAIDLQILVQNMLRMAGSHSIVGEIRGPEAWHLLDAIHNGMGGMYTIHGWSAEDALERLADRALEAGKQSDYSEVLHRISTNVRVVVHVREEQGAGGLRRVVQVFEITGLTDDRTRLRGHNLWVIDPETDELVPTATPSGRVLELLRQARIPYELPTPHELRQVGVD
jgi:pilus assembly protein CpaF